MSFAKIKELDNHLQERFGSGIEEIIVESDVFNNLMIDAAALRTFDSQFDGNVLTEATNIKFENIIITRSVRDRIKETEEAILKLQEKLNKLKTRTGY